MWARGSLALALFAALALLLPGACVGSCAQIEKRDCCPGESAPPSDCCCPPGIDVCCEAPKSVVTPVASAFIPVEFGEAPASLSFSPVRLDPAPAFGGLIPVKADLYLRFRVLLI